ncbi:proline racemase family protein [Halodesulfovibrio sp.]|nr:proline racemase family protein [Halodesulfovibrio sp.]
MVEPVEVGPCKGGVPEVTGTAHVTGKLKLIVDPNDPLKDGFHVC